MKKERYQNLTRLLVFCVLVAGLLVHTSSQGVAQCRSEIQISNGIPNLVIDDVIHPPFAYMSYLGEEKYYKEAADAGIHLYNIPSYLGDRGINSNSGIGIFREPIWTRENQFNFSALIKDFEAITKSDPKAKVIVRFYLDPPLWWEKLNPDACCLLPDGSTFRQCFASEKWRTETAKAFKYCLKWLLASPYANNLAGIHVAAGSTEEWFYHSRQHKDISPIRTEAFRKWLNNKYESIAALQRAWNKQPLTFETAELANISESNGRREWRNPEKDQNYIDSYQYHSEVMVDNISYFCKIVKEISNGDLLTGAFYGYHYFLTDPKSGHHALAKLLACPDLDYLSSPNVYNRKIGEDWPPMVAVQSVHLHGKLWLAENDTRTSITTFLKDRSTGIAPPGQYESGVWLGPEDMETSVALLWKNAGRMLAYGYGGWWFDMWGGWFSHPELLNVLEKTQQFHSEFHPNKQEKYKTEVCVLVDEELSFLDKSHGVLTRDIISNGYSLGKTGASYHLFLRSDLDAVSIEQYKVIWLMGVFELSKAEKQKISKWQEQGITVIWTNGNSTVVYKKNQAEKPYPEKIKWKDSELRELWKNAGVHVYNTSNDVTYVGNNWICIHTVKGGERTIKFPCSTQIYDPLKKVTLAESTKLFKVNLAPKSTILFRINPLEEKE